jgi:hypothetical protein
MTLAEGTCETKRCIVVIYLLLLRRLPRPGLLEGFQGTKLQNLALTGLANPLVLRQVPIRCARAATARGITNKSEGGLSFGLLFCYNCHSCHISDANVSLPNSACQ